MSDASDLEPRERDAEGGAAVRLLRAAELLASAHATRAKEEAARDVGRITTGALLLVLAIALVAPALLLFDVAAVLVVEERTRWGLPASSAFVAGVNLGLALVVALAARAKLMAPVMRETRATLKRAAAVLRGS